MRPAHIGSGRLRAPFFVTVAALSAGVAATAAAQQQPRFALPVECTLGRDCYIQQYVDRDPGPGVRDFACGALANDGHKGTDIALPTEAAMRAGVAVTAAAPGTVLRVRDGMADIRQGTEGAPDVTGRDCGNGLVISHGGGWETQYCHLRQGSVAVRPGDQVGAGTVVGLVGMSGLASFPHLHLSVRHKGRVVDPFRPAADASCGGAEQPLWADPIAYDPGGVIDAGLAESVPEYDAVKAGLPEDGLGPGAPAIVAWAFLANGQAGDVVTFEIAGPAGPFARHEVTIERAQPFLFRAFGRRAPEGGLPEGNWTARATVIRDGAPLDTAEVRAVIP
ncbi:M23 family peptidase [Rhodovulum sp. 12E13]|uniref:M23 family metallopeptidase n=1 Tax=Rhodovulum sp. 12E13 TaxID=2203891 RepID=UPI000E14088A|nr:M23 family metallopeptidase [Rhodovulum sp. 12E13]RDC73162.1 M23 family peptidase [Rhodovulum sp. 12E13]